MDLTAFTDTVAQDPKVQALDDAAIAILNDAEKFAITTHDEYNAAADMLRPIKTRQRELNDLRLSLTRPLDQAKAGVMTLFKPAGDRLAKAEQVIKAAMVGFTREVERKRREAEDAARALAAKEEQRLRKLEDAARERGDENRAEQFADRAASVPVPIVAAEKPQAAGIAMQTRWRAEVYDKLTLIRAIAEGRAPLGAVEPNMVLLNAQARSLKGEMAIPGVKAVADEGIAARAG